MPKRQLRPSLLPSIITLVLLGVLISLGTWQLNRSDQKRQLIDSYRQAPTLPPVSFADMKQGWQNFRFRKIQLNGQYDTEHQLYLENQVVNRRPGVMVLTPFKLAGRNDYIMVNRGWLERDPSMNVLPDIDIEGQIATVAGLVSHPPDVGIRLGSLDQSPIGWPKPVPYVDLNWIGLQIGARVLPWILLLDDNQKAGYLRDWKPAAAIQMPPEKHQSYAFQWYSLAIALLILFVVGSLKPEGGDNNDD